MASHHWESLSASRNGVLCLCQGAADARVVCLGTTAHALGTSAQDIALA